MKKPMPHKDLWQDADAKNWQQMLQNYDTAVDTKNRRNLKDLDRWFWQELQPAVLSRGEQHLTKDELVKLVEWKLARGSWRPKLLDYAKSQDPQVVENVTKQACVIAAKSTAAVNIKQALAALCSLKGVGPATASAVLSLVNHGLPFMSDEALQVTTPGSATIQYTDKAYLKVVEALNAKAASLGGEWTAVQVEKALWAAAVTGQTTAVAAAAPPQLQKRTSKKVPDMENSAPTKRARR